VFDGFGFVFCCLVAHSPGIPAAWEVGAAVPAFNVSVEELLSPLICCLR
jgi:hypothetical protein